VFIVILLVIFGISKAVDIPLRWDSAEGVTEYEAEMSVDFGKNWSLPRAVSQTDPDSNEVSFVWVGAPDSGLLLFRATSLRFGVRATRTKAGVWYNGDWELPGAPVEMGVN
jgi:hypothetical protein